MNQETILIHFKSEIYSTYDRWEGIFYVVPLFTRANCILCCYFVKVCSNSSYPKEIGLNDKCARI